ncbi:MAG: chemotaxis protein CheW, partial [Moraxellaceae bacterium]
MRCSKIFALDINYVERVTSSVEITTIPELPDYIRGVINYQTKIIPVINNRKLF